jgi:hypothetical protein
MWLGRSTSCTLWHRDRPCLTTPASDAKVRGAFLELADLHGRRLSINLNAAGALWLTNAQSVLSWAGEMIQ